MAKTCQWNIWKTRKEIKCDTRAVKFSIKIKALSPRGFVLIKKPAPDTLVNIVKSKTLVNLLSYISIGVFDRWRITLRHGKILIRFIFAKYSRLISSETTNKWSKYGRSSKIFLVNMNMPRTGRASWTSLYFHFFPLSWIFVWSFRLIFTRFKTSSPERSFHSWHIT